MNSYPNNHQEKEVYPKAEIKLIKDLLCYDLCIPTYQRPYKWKANKHVRQLIEDIIRESKRSENEENVEYRIGSIIFHVKDKTYNIVDGQQRLVTLSLIFEVLNRIINIETSKENFHELLKQKFPYKISKNNIKYNFEFITKYFHAISKEDAQKVRSYLLEHCSFVVIELDDIPEAFQLFDSQNARGKDLDPADLLKAFHLREMYENTYEEKRECVQSWEESIDQGLLNEVINKYLFRIRNWKQKNWEYYFTKEKVDDFKGINIFRIIQSGKIYPYLLRAHQNSMSSVFQLDEPIVNGKRFFEFVNNYVKLYSKIIDFTNNYTIDLDGDKIGIFNYSYSGRIGDRRIRTMYQIMLMCYVDKFGSSDDKFEDFAKELYRWAYQKRLEKKMIRYESILNIVKANDHLMPLNFLDKWNEPDILWFRSQIKPLNEIEIVKDQKGNISIKDGNNIKKFIEKLEQLEP